MRLMVTMGGHSRMGGNTYAGGLGGGIFALRRPRPYSRAFAGISLRGIAAPTIIYSHAGIYGNGVEADNDAARRVATSSEKRGE